MFITALRNATSLKNSFKYWTGPIKARKLSAADKGKYITISNITDNTYNIKNIKGSLMFFRIFFTLFHPFVSKSGLHNSKCFHIFFLHNMYCRHLHLSILLSKYNHHRKGSKYAQVKRAHTIPP